jgi:hypothetical protein
MNSEYSDEEDESFTLSNAMKYISENFIGLLLLVLTIVIIIVVEHITYINSLTYNMVKPPGMGAISGPLVIPTNPLQLPKIKGRKSKKARV